MPKRLLIPIRHSVSFLDRHAWFPVALLAMAILWFVYDRGPPVEIESAPPVPAASAGDWILFDLRVRRDLSRECSMSVTRYFMDAHGYRTDYVTNQVINADGIRQRVELMGDHLKLRVLIPASLPEGPASLDTETLYTCKRNPLMSIWPVRQSFSWPFIVLPKKPKGSP